MISGTFDQYIKFSKSFGGVRKAYEEQPKVLYGGFQFNIEDLPTAGQVLPAGAPVYCDEEKRTITPIYTVTVKEVADTVITVAKDSWGIPVKADMVLSTGETISKVENGDGVYKITLSAAPASVAAGNVLTFYPKSVGQAGVKANALLYSDVVLDPNAQGANGDGVWFGILLVNRTFPLTDDIKKQLADGGCFVRFSNRK